MELLSRAQRVLRTMKDLTPYEKTRVLTVAMQSAEFEADSQLKKQPEKYVNQLFNQEVPNSNNAV